MTKAKHDWPEISSCRWCCRRCKCWEAGRAGGTRMLLTDRWQTPLQRESEWFVIATLFTEIHLYPSQAETHICWKWPEGPGLHRSFHHWETFLMFSVLTNHTEWLITKAWCFLVSGFGSSHMKSLSWLTSLTLTRLSVRLSHSGVCFN